MLRLSLISGSRGLVSVSLAILAGASIPPAFAGDLVEPWDPGFTDVEAYASAEEGSSGAYLAGVLGFGLGRGWSAGLLVADDSNGDGALGATAIYTRELGGGVIFDVWAEAGVEQVSGDVEQRERDTGFLAGTEWSWDSGFAVPYGRLSVVDQSEGRYHALGGVMLPLAERLELHLELSTEWPMEGAEPIHLAVGPNVPITPWVEVLPEISAVRDRDADETTWAATLGVVIDPRGLRGARAGPDPAAGRRLRSER